MKKLIGVALFLGLMSCACFAQETPKPELFGGYQFTTLDPSWNASGWNGSATMYINRWVGVTGDFSGAYHSGANFHTYDEYVIIDSLVETAAIFALTATRLSAQLDSYT